MDDQAAPHAEIPPDKHALLEQLIQESGSEFNAFPLSFAQQRLWFLDQLQPDSPLYNLPSAVRLIGQLDLAALQRSLNGLIARHEALRTTIATVAGQPIQRIAPLLHALLTQVDLRALPAAERDAVAQQLTRAEAQRPFDLSAGPLLRTTLLRLADAEQILLLTMHHIIADGWSVGVFVRDLAALYDAAVTGRPARLPELPIQYADYADWQREWLLTAGTDQPAPLQTQLAYWKEQLAGTPLVLALPTDNARPLVQTFHGATRRFALGAPLSDALNALSRQTGVTLFMTLLATFQVLLYRYSGQDALLVGSPIANRTRAETEHVIGLFVNTLVLRGDLTGNPRFRDLLERVRAICLGAYAHQDVPFEKLVESLQPTRDLSHPPLVQVVFALQNAPMPALELAGLTLCMLEVDSGTAKFDLTLSLEEGTDGLSGWFEYNTDLFAATTITRLLGHFQTLLAGIVADPTQRSADLPLLTAAEQAQIHEVWNASAADYPHDAAVHTLFEAQAARTPDAVAVVFDQTKDEPSRDQGSGVRVQDGAVRTPDPRSLNPDPWYVTYAELNARANQLAHALIARGVGADTLVALCAERSLAMLVGILGILKAGGAYVPLDPTYPAERLAFMLDDSQASVIVVAMGDGAETARRAVSTTVVVDLIGDWPTLAGYPTDNPPRSVTSEQRAYVIYTSGSTGRPKGVMVLQRGLLNLVYGLRRFFDDPAVAAVGLITSISFDISVNQIFPTLLFGRTLHIIPDAVKFDSIALLGYAHAHGLHVLDAVPSYIQAVLRDLAPAQPPNTFRYLLIGGEPLDPVLVQQIFAQLGAQVAVVNIYGLSEISDVNAFAVITTAQQDAPVTIGQPLQNNQLYILNPRWQLQPIGVVGELCIAGASLSRGYLNRPELTAERFVPNPFAEGDKETGRQGDKEISSAAEDTRQSAICNLQSAIGARLCATGDLARWRADGRIELLGRRDHQVKVRGFRIEVGEIETLLAVQPGVRECAVVARTDAPGDTRLVAYVVQGSGVRDQGSGDASVEPPNLEPRPLIPDLRTALKQQLPEYMVPSAFVLLDALPKTPNGKIDRRALPAPDMSRLGEEDSFVAPRTPIEAVLANIWMQMLRVERVGVYDNFFELGGHSLLATQLATRLRSTFQVDLPLRSLFEATTVVELAQIIVAHEVKPGQSDKIARVIRRLEAMSVEDARALLQKKEQGTSVR